MRKYTVMEKGQSFVIMTSLRVPYASEPVIERRVINICSLKEAFIHLLSVKRSPEFDVDLETGTGAYPLIH